MLYHHPMPSFLAVLCLCLTIHHIRGESCSEHFTCKSPDRTADYLQYLKLNSSVPIWYELCNCDSYCHVFGDCCPDAPVLKQIALDEWSFVKVRPSNNKNVYLSLLKSKCSPQWKQPNNVKEKCEVSTGLSPLYDYLLPEMEHLLLLSPEDEFSNWHVTSRQSLVSYRNLHCSICNNDPQVDAWSQRLRCSTNGGKSDPTCTSVYFQAPPSIIAQEKVKRIPHQNKVYSSCSLGWYKMNVARQQNFVLDTVKKCLISYAPTVVRDPKSKKYIVFKNQYCALCNDYDASQHKCPIESIDHQTQVPASFNLISDFDANYQTGSSIAETNNSCDAGKVYNPLMSNCQTVIRVMSQSRPKASPSLKDLSKVGSSASSLQSGTMQIFSSLFLTLALMVQ